MTAPLRKPRPTPPLVAFLVRHRFLLTLLLLDIATKVAAFRLLPEAEPVVVFPGVRLFLALNEWGVMGGVHGMNAITARSAYDVMLAIGLFFFALVVQRLGVSSLRVGWRVLVGLMAFFAVAVAAETVALPLADVRVPATILVSILRLAVLAVTLAFYAVMTAPLPRVAFTLLAAGALGNSLSFLYPPFAVVDFLILPLTFAMPLLGVWAAGSPDDIAGVINMADVYLFLFPFLVLAWPVSALVRAGRRLARA